jgi:FHA domain-containing protein/von Willebrand factor type A domain-containing protein
MFSKHSIVQFLTAFIVFCFFSSSINAWQELTGELDIRCEQLDIQLECHYRPLFPGSVSNIRALSRNLEMPVEEVQNKSGNFSAIFFLIDTSDPGRQNVINKNIQQIKTLVNTSNSSHRLGLATFDKKLRILAPIGSSKKQLIASVKDIKAEGRTTELYRNLLLTIEKLSRTNASRKAIFLFSDGQAEDKAYFHSDVVKAARRKGIVINSIGFPRSVSLSVALQTLRRLSEETGGSFTEANSNFDLNEKFYRKPFRNIDAGKGFVVDITELAETARLSLTKITLEFTTDIGNINIKVPVSLSPVIAIPPPGSPVNMSPAAPIQTTIKMVTPESESENINFWLWYGLPIALVFLFSVALITLILIYRKQPDKNVFANSIREQVKPFAYLVSQEENSIRYPILSTTWRIGRSQDNELTLDDNSVSRLHAEIHRDNNGDFFIMDMKSLNGVYVNEEQVLNQKIQEGDILEIGDIYLRFTLYAENYQLEENTSIQKTKIPAH